MQSELDTPEPHARYAATCRLPPGAGAGATDSLPAADY